MVSLLSRERARVRSLASFPFDRHSEGVWRTTAKIPPQPSWARATRPPPPRCFFFQLASSAVLVGPPLALMVVFLLVAAAAGHEVCAVAMASWRVMGGVPSQ